MNLSQTFSSAPDTAAPEHASCERIVAAGVKYEDLDAGHILEAVYETAHRNGFFFKGHLRRELANGFGGRHA